MDKVYKVFRNGNELVAAFDDLKKATKKFFSIAKRGDYVEIWVCYSDGSRHLISYEN